MNPKLSGIFTALVSPFDRDGVLRLEWLPPLLERQRAAGIDGVVIGGTNGEGPSMSVQERQRLLKAAMSARGALQVVAGTGAASITDALELTHHAADAGAAAALVLPPFYFKNPTAQGVARYFETILDRARLPVLLYNIPQQSAVPITDPILAILKGHPRLAGLKDSAGDWSRTSVLIREHPALAVFPGSDSLLTRSLLAGAAGAMSGTGNAFPEQLAAVRDAVSRKENPAPAQDRLDRARAVLMDFPLISASKAVMAHRGAPRLWARPPLVDTTPEQEAELLERLRSDQLL